MGIQEVSPQNLFGGILKNRKEQLKILEGNQQILSQKKCIGFYFFDISLEDHDDGLKKMNKQLFWHPSLRALLHPYLSSCLPIAGGPTKIRGRFWFGCNQKVRGQSKNVGWKGAIRVVTWYEMTFMQIRRWKCSKQIIKPVKKECWAKNSVICELEIYANRCDLTCCLYYRQYLRSQIMTEIECKSPAKYVHPLDNMWKLAWKC